MPSGHSKHGRVRLPIRMDRFVATIDAPLSLAPAVRHLLIDMTRTDTDPVGHVIEIDETSRISMDGRRWDPGDDQTLFDQLIYLLMQASLEEDTTRLHLHAALVGYAGRSLLIAGVAGSGKSTLVAQLVAESFVYFSDERTALDSHLGLSPLPKPISIAYGAGGPLQHLAHLTELTGGADHRLWHLPASGVRLGSVGSSVPPLAGIVLVEYRPDAPVTCTALHPVTVARVLIADSLDAAQWGAEGAMTVLRLCTSVPCVGVVHGGGGDVRALLRSIAEDRSAEVASRAEVTPITGGTRAPSVDTSRVGAASVLGRASGIQGALAADRALIIRGDGEVVELDEMLTAWFLLLDGSTPLGVLVDEIAAEAGTTPDSLLDSAIAVVEHLTSLRVAA